MADLSLVPVEQLVEEIKERFDCIVFIGEKDHGNQTSRYTRYAGPSGWKLGLAHIAQREIEDYATGPSDDLDDGKEL